jgi:hypothetical protein
VEPGAPALRTRCQHRYGALGATGHGIRAKLSGRNGRLASAHLGAAWQLGGRQRGGQGDPVSVKRSRTDAVRALLGSPVVFHPTLARLCDSVTAGLMLSQAIYWSDRTPDRSGWFYKSGKQWEDEICLSRHEQETARDKLLKLGFLREVRGGMPCTMHYFVDVSALIAALSQLPENSQTNRRRNTQPASGNLANQFAETQPTRWRRTSQPYKEAEITTETSTETKATTPTQVDRKQIAKLLREVEPGIDQAAVDRLIEDCQNVEPNATTDEIEYFVRRLMARSNRIENPVGFLIAQVPACFEGETYQLARQELVRQKNLAAETKEREAREAIEREQYLAQIRAEEQEAEDRRMQEAERRAAAKREAERRAAELQAVAEDWTARWYHEHPGTDSITWTEIPDDLWEQVKAIERERKAGKRRMVSSRTRS